MLYYKMLPHLLAVLIPFIIIIIIVYCYWKPIKCTVLENLNNRFFSIILGLIASAIVLFVFHASLKILEICGVRIENLLDEQFSYLFKTFFAILITTIFIIVFHIELKERAKQTLAEIDRRYKDLSGYAFKYFEQLYNLRNSFEDNLIFNEVIKNHQTLGKENKFIVTLRTYLDIIVKFLENGYELKSINSTKLPFWFSPDETDESVMRYMDFLAKHKERKDKLTRITYYKNKEWMNDTVRCIYEDIDDSEKSKVDTIKWILTLISNIDYAKKNELNALLEFDLTDNIEFATLQDHHEYIELIEKFCRTQTNLDRIKTFIRNNSVDMTNVVNAKFKEIMGEKGCHRCKLSEFEARFPNDEKEVGYFEKDDSKFALQIIGPISSTVTLQIVTDNDAVAKISQNIESLIELAKNYDAR